VAPVGRLIGGFFLLMVGFGVILDTSWDTIGSLLCLAGGGLMLSGAWSRG
jgi:hypothetical protein